MKYVIVAIKVNAVLWGAFHGWKAVELYWPIEPLGAGIVALAIILGCGLVLFFDEPRAVK